MPSKPPASEAKAPGPIIRRNFEYSPHIIVDRTMPGKNVTMPIPMAQSQVAADGAAGKESFSPNEDYSNNVPNPDNYQPPSKSRMSLREHGKG